VAILVDLEIMKEESWIDCQREKDFATLRSMEMRIREKVINFRRINIEQSEILEDIVEVLKRLTQRIVKNDLLIIVIGQSLFLALQSIWCAVILKHNKGRC